MKLKFWAFVYRNTGYFSPYVEQAQEKYMTDNIDRIRKQYSESYSNKDGFRFTDLLGMEIGKWQAANGFSLTSKQFKRKIKRTFKKKLKSLKKYKR